MKNRLSGLEGVGRDVAVGIKDLGEGASGFIGDIAVGVVFVSGECLNLEDIGGIGVREAGEEIVDGDVEVGVFCCVIENGSVRGVFGWSSLVPLTVMEKVLVAVKPSASVTW